jgi:hypothetical protein
MHWLQPARPETRQQVLLARLMPNAGDGRFSDRNVVVPSAKVSDFVEYVCKSFRCGIFASAERAQIPLKSCTKHRPIAFAFACNLILPPLLRER